MAWRRPGDKPLSEPTVVSLLTHICVTRPQWVKKLAHWQCMLWIQDNDALYPEHLLHSILLKICAVLVNSFSSEQNCHHFWGSKSIFVNENYYYLIQIYVNFVYESSIESMLHQPQDTNPFIQCWHLWRYMISPGHNELIQMKCGASGVPFIERGWPNQHWHGCVIKSTNKMKCNYSSMP